MEKENKNLKDKNNFSFNQKNNSFNKNDSKIKSNQKKSNKKFQKMLLLDELEKIDNTKTSQVINNKNDVNISKSIKNNKDKRNISQVIDNKNDINIYKSIKNNKENKNISQVINNENAINISNSTKNKEKQNISNVLKKEILQDEKVQKRLKLIMENYGVVKKIEDIHKVFNFDLNTPFKTVFRWEI